MAAPLARVTRSLAVRDEATTAWKSLPKVMSLAQKLTQLDAQDAADRTAREKVLSEDQIRSQQQHSVPLKSFSLHLGAELKVPTSCARIGNAQLAAAEQCSDASNPFAGLPLQAWAERLGERVMPAYEVIKEEQEKVKRAAKSAVAREVPVPTIPHILPFTHWAATSTSFKDTLIAEDPKTRKRARLSWYHPDDTMVPRNWFKGGLLADLKYYSPFRKSEPKLA